MNKYERDQAARKKYISVMGVRRLICGMNFEKRYGKIGKNFIHVHHIVPLSEIKMEYQVNPVEDLIPVCPNCHAMLHQKIDGKYIEINKLKELYIKNN